MSSSSKLDTRQSTFTPMQTSPEDSFSISMDLDCISDRCPIYCCDTLEDDDEIVPMGQEDDSGINHQHIERKRSGNISTLKGELT